MAHDGFHLPAILPALASHPEGPMGLIPQIIDPHLFLGHHLRFVLETEIIAIIVLPDISRIFRMILEKIREIKILPINFHHIPKLPVQLNPVLPDFFLENVEEGIVMCGRLLHMFTLWAEELP